MAGELIDFFLRLQLWLLVNVAVQACDPPCLYFSAGRVIKSIELSSNKITSNVTEPQLHDGRVLAVAVDVEEKTLYFSDQVSRTIKRIDLQSNKIEVVASEVGHCEGIAIDWVHKYIYWTDNENDRIEMSRVNGSDRKVLFDKDVQNPRGITVDPVHGYMFWTDYGNNPTIERATLAGQERTPIISSNTTLKYPNDVIVDYSSNRIYWVDAGLDVVGTADVQGHYINISEPIKSSHLYAMALYDNTLYISNVETNAKSIIVIDKESLKESKRFTSSVIESRDILGMTMLHESRQPPANFTNCRTQPCQNEGTCYFNFQMFTDECTCTKYYADKDCGLYLGSGAVRITLEMEVKEWEVEQFKQAITKGMNDYCNCDSRNESISKQVCPSILNNSAFRATQVAVIGQPEASLPNRTKVEFAVLLPPESSSKPLVVVNTTLEYIVWESAHYINKHFNKTVLVNNLHQPSDKCIDIVDSTVQKRKNHAAAIGITFAVVILLAVSVVVVVCYRRKRFIERQRENQQRVNNEEGIDGGYEDILIGGQRENQRRGNNEEGIDGGLRYNREDNNDGCKDSPPVQRDNQQRRNNKNVLVKKFDNTQASSGGSNIVDNQ